MDDVIVFGEALLDAYETESSLAVYPRIILNHKAKLFVGEIIERYPLGKKSKIGDFLMRDKDDNLFINYLAILKEEYIAGDKSYRTRQLNDHKTSIQNNLEKYINSKKILEKYIWVAKYHNKFCLDNCDKDEIKDLIIEIDKYVEKYFTI